MTAKSEVHPQIPSFFYEALYMCERMSPPTLDKQAHMKCAPLDPTKPNLRVAGSCYTVEAVHKMVDQYNSSSSRGGTRRRAVLKPTTISKKEPARRQVELLRTYLKDEIPKSCTGEWCLAETSTMQPLKQEIKKHFRPQIPSTWKKNPRTWLNTNDILHAIKQYELAFPQFYFITVTPIDFDTHIIDNGQDTCVDQRLCTLDVAQHVRQGRTLLGTVFNLDKHYQSGSHWTAMFVDIHRGEGYYFDSVASDVPTEVYELFKRIKTQSDDLVLKGDIAPPSLINYDERLPIKSPIYESNGSRYVSVAIGDIVNYLLEDDNFVMYRYARFYADEVKKRCTISINISDTVAKKILSRVFELVDKTSNHSYAQIDDLEQIMSEYMSAGRKRGSRQPVVSSESLQQFAREWIRGQLKLSICNMVEMMRVFHCKEYNRSYRVERSEYDEQSKMMRFYLADAPAATQETLTFRDASFHCFKNYVQHQFKNTECGMYCINFIDNMITRKKKFSKLIRYGLDDDYMNSLRYTKYFTAY